ncbi:MAG: TRAP transporter small permease [Clostridiales bacterium]|nr:TRAP transporter small permease [Clostridiales bacterium]
MLQVFTRVTPNTIAVKWTVEMGSILLCALLWVGIGQGISHKSHIRFTMVIEMFPPKIQKIFEVFGDFVYFVFCAILAYYTWSMLQFYAANNTRTTILQWGKQWTKLPMFLGLVVAMIRLALVALTTLSHLNDFSSDTKTNEGGE